MASLKRESIKDQMVNTAARLWGIEESEIEQNFDPLILLLIEACSAELEKIGHNITESHTRLIDYLAQIMLPGSLFGAIPASGIIQASPLETKVEIGPESGFFLSQKVFRQSSGNTETVDMHFTPTGKVALLKSELAYLISGNKLFRIKENNSKELLYAPDRNINSNEIWLVLSPDKALTSLAGLNIYFDLRGHSSANNFYNSLAYVKGSQNEIPLTITNGLGTNEEQLLDQRDMLVLGDDLTNKVNRKVKFIYQNRFLHISEGPQFSYGVPDQWKEKLPPEMSAQMVAEKLVFVKIELSQYFPQEVFDIVTCTINSFPVVNKKLSTFNYRTDDWLNIIPLPATGVFFDLAAIKNESNEHYKIRPSAGVDGLVAGEAIVRTSGVGKTSSPEVREMINNITETIRDQSAYFGQLSNDFILGRLREIGKILAGLEDNMEAAKDKKQQYHYLMLRPKKNGEMVTIEYWVTNGTDANNIKAGSLISAANALINSKKSLTVTNFAGGKNGVSETEKNAILRQQLISGGKIISVQDVKLLCAQLYGDKLKSVEVKKGVSVSNKMEEGFLRTLDVVLSYSSQVNESMKTEMDHLGRELEYILQGNASPVYPFRIIVANPNP